MSGCLCKLPSLIEDSLPETWQELQFRVARIFTEIGLFAEVGKQVATPRGNIEIDVYAVDLASVDKTSYVVECKNWKNAVPQAVVHSFLTVMQEVGANIGLLVARDGLQSGAKGFTINTNVIGLSYAEFQLRYLEVWFERCFVKNIGDVVDSLFQYVEPFNIYRDKCVENLSEDNKVLFERLRLRYSVFGQGIIFFEYPRYVPDYKFNFPQCICSLNKLLNDLYGDGYIFDSHCYRDLQLDIITVVDEVTGLFNNVFGKDIFKTRC
jgi:hypothetical protein